MLVVPFAEVYFDSGGGHRKALLPFGCAVFAGSSFFVCSYFRFFRRTPGLGRGAGLAAGPGRAGPRRGRYGTTIKGVR